MRSHSTDRVSLFFGLAFLMVAGAFLAHRVLDVDLPDGRWFVAGGLVLFGLLGVLGALVPSRSRRAAPAEPAPAVETETPAGQDARQD